MTSLEIKQAIVDKLNMYFATKIQNATPVQVYKAVALVLRDVMLDKKQRNNEKINKKGAKRVYYLCMEFLLGKSLRNNLYNLSMLKNTEAAIKELGFDMQQIYEIEQDPGLGNGGLGRLAACFMDSLASLNYPAMGFSIRYEYGLFKQKIVENQQVELPDMWLDTGEAWMLPRSDKCFEVKIGGTVNETWENDVLQINYENPTVIEAFAYDVMIPGANSDGVSVLRLWRAAARHNFDMKSFTQGDYMRAMRADNEAELISKVLYPSDDHEEGKQLRLTQQYFLVSASLQNIIQDYLKWNKNLNGLPQKIAIHINDTHPALAVPELMRILIDEYKYDWDVAFKMTTQIMGYTNHTVLAEALEKWEEGLFKTRLPRIYSIIKEIDNRFRYSTWEKYHDAGLIDRTAIVNNGVVKMANLSVIGSHSVNGVSALHSNIIKTSVFSDYNMMYPNKFTNVTNGIAYRRWLCQSNPSLTNLIKELIGDGFIKDASKLKDLEKFANDSNVLKKLAKVKLENKHNFADFIAKRGGMKIDANMRIDTQIKRLHEYKRQLLNVLKIIYYYCQIEQNPDMQFTPQCFIFGAKAAGGYYHAKRIITLINCLSEDIRNNSKINKKLQVYFVENYNVTVAESLIPASEVSEQISLAGKEASGTSNMKFMMNGAVTLGTIDGANVEIKEYVGDDNIFTFGLTDIDVDRVWREGYSPSHIYSSNEKVRIVVDRLKQGFGGQDFSDIAGYLIFGHNNVADPYMCLQDFESYLDAAERLDKAYNDELLWNKLSLINIARSGGFSSDRSIEEYAKNIWDLKKI